MPEQPLVTVFVLCYNTGHYVCEALECLRNQTYTNLQILICDDASSDQSVELVSTWLRTHELPAQFICNKKNLGLTAVFNLLLKEAKGEFITWLSDDKWANDRVAKCVAAF
ncbi:MAG: glycosyltransferase family 2 protein, partial [Bacteroidia bacterium]